MASFFENMIGIFSRHRSLALLASVVLAQTLLLAFQIKRNRDVRLIRVWAVEVMTPIERLGTWTTSTTKGAWMGYIDLHNARSENDRLGLNWARCRSATKSSKARRSKTSAWRISGRSARGIRKFKCWRRR